MKSRVLPVVAVILVTMALVAGACSAGFVVGQVSAQGWDMALELPHLPGLKLTPHGADDLTDGIAAGGRFRVLHVVRVAQKDGERDGPAARSVRPG